MVMRRFRPCLVCLLLKCSWGGINCSSKWLRPLYYLSENDSSYVWYDSSVFCIEVAVAVPKKKPLHFTCFHHTTPHAWKIMNFYVYLPEKMNYIKERVLPMPWLRSFLFHLLRVWKWKWNIWLKKDCIWIPHRYLTWFQNLKRDNIVWKAPLNVHGVYRIWFSGFGS